MKPNSLAEATCDGLGQPLIAVSGAFADMISHLILFHGFTPDEAVEFAIRGANQFLRDVSKRSAGSLASLAESAAVLPQCEGGGPR